MQISPLKTPVVMATTLFIQRLNWLQAHERQTLKRSC